MSHSSPLSYRLFKYRSIIEQSRLYTSRIITNRHIYYAAPKQFNDPFDCQFCVNMIGAPLSAYGLAKQAEIKALAEKVLLDDANNNVSVLSLTPSYSPLPREISKPIA
ncbi:MAG: hypothetical protein ACR2FY_01695 [Pirellulaceae bacterium]